MGNNTKPGSAGKIKLNKFDDLFETATEQDTSAEKIINVPLAELRTFKDYPFQVVDDEKMEETTESICQYGGLCRELPDRGQTAAMKLLLDITENMAQNWQEGQKCR